MNTLNATKKIQVVLAGAKNTNDCPVTASWKDENLGNQMGGFPIARRDSTSVVTAGATAVDLIASSGDNSVLRTITGITFFNKDLAAVTVTLQEVDSALNTTREVYKVTLQTLEQFFYTEGIGFEAQDVNGAVKSQAAATSSATSTAQLAATSALSILTQINAPASVLSTSVQASSLAAAIVPASVNSVSSQASSLAAAVIPASVNSVSSQASSMATLVPASVSSQASLGISYLARWSTTISKTSSSFSF